MNSKKLNLKNLILLSQCGRDLTAMAEKGELDPILCRGREIELVMQILCRKRKKIPCFVGSPDIVLASIVEGLAQRIANGSAPSQFLGKKVIAIKKRQLFADCEPSCQLQRVVALTEEIKRTDGRVILYLDDVEVLVRVGAMVDQCIGSITKKGYEMYKKSNTDLRDIVQFVVVREPSMEETFENLKVLQKTYGTHHNVKYTEDALLSIAQLSSQSHSDGSVFDKAIDMIDEVGARVSLENSKISRHKRKVTKEHITKVGTLSNKLVRQPIIQNVRPLKKSKSLLNMEVSLRNHIIGQEDAIGALSRSLIRARAEIRDPSRPVGSFIFVGPTGVGKTELANAIAMEFFGSMKYMKKLDMSEYKEEHSVSKLFGAPPGYSGYSDGGGTLTNAIMYQPKSVVLFDEIEKAHPKVYNSFLQVLEDGRLTDSKGRVANFTETILIFTSNIGQKLFNDPELVDDYQELKIRVTEEVKNFLLPEFLNRLDDVIVFRQIGNLDDLKKILEIMLRKLFVRLKEKKNLQVKIEESVKNKLIKEGYNPIYGVRPLRRCITRLIEDTLAQWIIDGDVNEGDSIIIDLDSQGNIIKM